MTVKNTTTTIAIGRTGKNAKKHFGRKEMKMQVHFNTEATEKEFSLAIGFKKAELNFALSVLRGINAIVKADWIAKAIHDVEEYLKPPTLPFINYFRLCEICKCEFDERTGDGFLNNQKDKTFWKHYKCPELKPNRPN
jgi:hypothetical protein